MRARHGLIALLVTALPALIVNACSDTEVTSSGASGTGASASSAAQSGGSSVGGAGAAGGAGGATGGTGTAGGGVGACSSGGTQCTDCIDNDNDGFSDAWDSECVGPLDNDEGSFATGIPGDNKDCKQDCFFDGNSGSGDDGCVWDLACDPLNPGAPECPYDPDKNNCPEITQQCLDNCGKFTPNGCDCFGCCEITLPDMTKVTISLGLQNPECETDPTKCCTEETATDPTICKPCTQVQDCLNPCEPCEYCLGKVTLPPECGPMDGGMGTGGSGGNSGGCSPCAPEFPCPAGEYCLTGCCIPQ